MITARLFKNIHTVIISSFL